MPRIDKKLVVSGTLAMLLQGNLLVGCSSGSLVSGETPQSDSGMTKKSGVTTDLESDEADLPSEISGAFLTCSFVPVKEGGFGESSSHAPVGCALMKDDAKVRDAYLTLKLGLFKQDGEQLLFDTKEAPQESQWHYYGHLNRQNTRDLYLGITVTDQRNGKSSKPIKFPVTDLKPSQGNEDEIALNLAGGYVSEKRHNVDGTVSNNIDTPFLPKAYCMPGGVLRREVDVTQYKNQIVSVGRRIAEFIDGTGILGSNQLAPSKKLQDGRPPKDSGCFSCAKQADPERWDQTVRESAVIEAEGCLFLQSSTGILIYGAEQRKTYNINREYLAKFVKAHQCANSARATRECPSK